MAKNTKRHKTTNLPAVVVPPVKQKTLPYDSNAVVSKGFSFSFENFDREEPLFNLGDESGKDRVVSGKWFLDLLACLKDASGYKDRQEWRTKRDLHPVDWDHANAPKPANVDQYEYYQFRINKSRGRVIGYFIDETFYIVWFDPHHNLTDSEGYGTATYYNRPRSEYEDLLNELHEYKEKDQKSQKYIEELEELLSQ